MLKKKIERKRNLNEKQSVHERLRKAAVRWRELTAVLNG
jgi:hypothetical protein